MVDVKMDDKEALAAAEAEVKAFDGFFCSLGNSPMVGSERAILKTYLLATLTDRFPSSLPAGRTSAPKGC